MGRRPLGGQAMTDAERQRRRREKLKDDPVRAIKDAIGKLTADQRERLLAELKAS